MTQISISQKSREYAEVFVESYEKRFKGLDYSEASLKVVDKILETDYRQL